MPLTAYDSLVIFSGVSWTVGFHPAFDEEFEALSDAVQDQLLARAEVLEQVGPRLGRPRADTLNGSRHRNMKELRFNADGGERFDSYLEDRKEVGQ